MLDPVARHAPALYAASTNSLFSGHSSSASLRQQAPYAGSYRQDGLREVASSDVPDDFARLEQVLLQQRSEMETFLQECSGSGGAYRDAPESQKPAPGPFDVHEMRCEERQPDSSYRYGGNRYNVPRNVVGLAQPATAMSMDSREVVPERGHIANYGHDAESFRNGMRADHGRYGGPEHELARHETGGLAHYEAHHTAHRGSSTLVGSSSAPRRAVERHDHAQNSEFEEEHGNASGGKPSSEVCHICGKSFMNQITLQNHIRVVHEKAGEFKCDACKKVFMWRSTLRNHVRLVHEKHRPHKCEICDLRFRWKSHLEEHVIVVHNREQPWKCEKCGKLFGRKNNCKKHSRRCGGASARPGFPLVNRDGQPDATTHPG